MGKSQSVSYRTSIDAQTFNFIQQIAAVKVLLLSRRELESIHVVVLAVWLSNAGRGQPTPTRKNSRRRGGGVSRRSVDSTQ